MSNLSSQPPVTRWGVHAATVCPMHPDGRIDTEALTEHLVQVCLTEGISGLLLNGHAGEGHLLTHAERARVIEVARSNTQQTCFITAGITSEATHAAVEEARISASAGADALLVFPPNHWSAGVDPEMAVSHHAAIAKATDLPLVLYKAPITAGHISYSEAVTTRLLKDIGAIVAIKEGSWEVAAYERTWRLAASLRPDVAVLGSGDEHLLTSYLIGSKGSQVSLAAVIPDTIVALFNAAQENDWVSARASHEVLYDLSVAIYRDAPGYLATARLKACLKLLGRIPTDIVRGPMRQLTASEVARLQAVLSALSLTSGIAS